MKSEAKQPTGTFQKVGECLYRYSSNGVYYARIKTPSKEIRQSLRTTDRQKANRELRLLKEEQQQIDRSQGKITLAELCDRYLMTVQHQKPKTIERKTLIVRRIKDDWPTAKQTQVAKVKPSDVDLWLSRYHFGPVSRNLHVACAKEIFEMALRDNVIARSPARLRSVKLDKPIRKTPSFEVQRHCCQIYGRSNSTLTLRKAPTSSSSWLGARAAEVAALQD
jgi:hypothetical protein